MGAPSKSRPPEILSLEEVEQRNPGIVDFMKRRKPDRFEDCGVVIVSFPSGQDGPRVYGYFVVDKREALKPKSRRQVKQDFVVVDDPDSGVARYYTGWRKGQERPPRVQSIESFCDRFGVDGGYGCTRVGSRWRCRDHEYMSERDPHLPPNPRILAAIAATMDRIRGRIGK